MRTGPKGTFVCVVLKAKTSPPWSRQIEGERQVFEDVKLDDLLFGSPLLDRGKVESVGGHSDAS